MNCCPGFHTCGQNLVRGEKKTEITYLHIYKCRHIILCGPLVHYLYVYIRQRLSIPVSLNSTVYVYLMDVTSFVQSCEAPEWKSSKNNYSHKNHSLIKAIRCSCPQKWQKNSQRVVLVGPTTYRVP